ncbi:MAG: hypothetical protein LUE21_05785 [Oscillospiraceae bacterium]|nr:hypothetical protein [Oscillospiraceae bacterium]
MKGKSLVAYFSASGVTAAAARELARAAEALRPSVSGDTELVIGKLLNGRQTAAGLKKWMETIQK